MCFHALKQGVCSFCMMNLGCEKQTRLTYNIDRVPAWILSNSGQKWDRVCFYDELKEQVQGRCARISCVDKNFRVLILQSNIFP